MKDENIYVFIRARANYFGQIFEYSDTYSIGPSVNQDDIYEQLAKDMNEYFKDYLDDINPITRPGITTMNEISKELYDRLHQKH